MTKVEDLQGIQGRFEGTICLHPKFKRRAVAYGELTYNRMIDAEEVKVAILVKGVRVRRLDGPEVNDFRRYIRVKRGPKGNRDKIIGLIDQD